MARKSVKARTRKTVGDIVGTDHERIEGCEDGANGEEIVPSMNGHGGGEWKARDSRGGKGRGSECTEGKKTSFLALALIVTTGAQGDLILCSKRNGGRKPTFVSTCGLAF